MTGSDSNDDVFVLDSDAAIDGTITGGAGGTDVFYIDDEKFAPPVISDNNGSGTFALTKTGESTSIPPVIVPSIAASRTNTPVQLIMRAWNVPI